MNFRLESTFGNIGKEKKPKGKLHFVFDSFYQKQDINYDIF